MFACWVRLTCAALLIWLVAVHPATAGAALVYNAVTKQVLYAENPDHPWYPASLTKLMTAYVVFETWKAGKAERTGKITISARANSRPKMRLGLGTGKVITYDEAIAALILHSANDIAVALAEAVSGSEAAFVEQMNATAVRLGMASTRFINANGLPGEGQHATARDLATLTQAILRDFPEHAGLFALRTAPVGARTVATHNPAVLRVAGGDGMKTGFTCSAGYNIIASATREENRLVAIVLGEQTSAKREIRMKALLEQGFQMLRSTGNPQLAATEAQPLQAPQPLQTLETLPVAAFDAEQVRAANLTKRFNDCKPPEPVLDADGNPVCPPVKTQKQAKTGKAVKVANAAKGPKGKPDTCAPVQPAKVKVAVRRTRR